MGLLLKAINSYTNSKWGKKLISPYAPAAIGTLTTLSGVTKDAFNCIFYTYQSYTNDRIPEDKRNFVAALDLSNGILNVTLQSAIGAMVTAATPFIFRKCIAPKYFPKDLYKTLLSKYPGLSRSYAKQAASNMKILAEAGLTAVGTLLATQVFTKRVIVPFIATPLASLFKKKFDQKEGKVVDEPKNQPDQKDTVSLSNKKQVEKTENINKGNNKTNVALVDNNDVITVSHLNKNLPNCYKTFAK